MLKSLQAVLAAGLLLVGGASAAAPAGTPVAVHGRLKVCGTKMCNENGTPVQLTGMSSHGLSWTYGDFMNSSSIQWMYTNWGVNVVRAAMYSADYNGYANTPGNRGILESRVDDIVTGAENAGVYAIIDWHILKDNDPTTYQTEAVAFFKLMAGKYKDKKHVIYEICNEPNGSTSWATIKAYAKVVIPAIRAIDPNAIIVVGSPSWSQLTAPVANDPLLVKDVVSGSSSTSLASNIMYTLHFYSGTHGQEFRNNGDYAISKGLAIFVTEWGTSVADGGLTNKTAYTAESDVWIKWMADNGISWCNWSLGNKDEGASALTPSTSNTAGNWTSSNLTASGTYVVGKIKAATANFGLPGPFAMTATATAGGSVSVSPTPNSGTKYTKGTAVTLTATPSQGYVFKEWTGSTPSTSKTLVVTMLQDMNQVANFKLWVPNAPPILRDTTLAVMKGGTGTLTLEATDTDGVVTAYKVAGFNSTKATVTIAGSKVTYVSKMTVAGLDTFTVSATDDSGAVKTAKVFVTVRAANQAPIRKAKLPDLTLTRETQAAPILLSDYFTEPDGQTLNYIVVSANPALDTAYALNGYLYVKAKSLVGSSTIRVRATDGALLALDTMALTVTGANVAPVLADMAMSMGMNVKSTLKMIAKDSNNNVKSYSVTTAPKHGTATISNDTVTYVPASGYVGTDTFYVKATDDSGLSSAPAKVVVTVNAINRAPVVAKKLADVTVANDTTISLAGLFTDPDGNTLNYVVTNKSPAFVSTTVSGTDLSLKLLNSGAATLIVTANDGSLSVSDTVVVTVKTATVAPIAILGTMPALTIEPWGKTQVDLDVYFSSNTGKQITFTASGSPGGACEVSVSGGMLTITTGNVGTDKITIVATDGTNSVTQTFDVTVSDGKTGIFARPTSRMGGLSMGGSGSVVRPKMLGVMNGAMGVSLAACAQDGECQSTSIAMAYAGRVDVDIYDQLGVRVIAWSRTLKDADLKLLPTDSENRRTLDLQWNLRSASGRLVGSGVYLWKIRVTANDGTWAETVVRQGVSIER